MKVYQQGQKGYYCGFWNGSPIEVKYSSGTPIRTEPAHSHDFREYYLITAGSVCMQVGETTIELNKLELLMVEPGEKHKISSKTADASYVIIKEKSFEGNKK